MNISQINPSITANYAQKKQNVSYNTNLLRNNVSFGCAPAPKSKFFAPLKKMLEPATKLYDKGVDSLATGIAKVLDTRATTFVLDKTKRNKNLFNYLMTTGSVILSGLYISRTLNNKDLDEKKKKTLAINQALVFAASTILCFVADGRLTKKVANFASKFEAVNYKAGMDKAQLQKCIKGIDTAKKIMIFDTIYRFIAPVFITPIANIMGNKLNDSQTAQPKLAK